MTEILALLEGVPGDAVLLLNLTGRPMFVLVDGQRRQLPEAPAPQLLDPVDRGASTLRVHVPGAGAASLRMSPVAQRSGGLTLGVPPEHPRLRYLVSKQTALQFPHRSDFLCPAVFRGVHVVAVGESAGPVESALVAVTVGCPVAGVDAEDITGDVLGD